MTASQQLPPKGGTSAKGWGLICLYIYEDPSRKISEGMNCEGECFKKGVTADTSSYFVGDVEAKVSPCKQVGRWRGSVVTNTYGGQLFYVKRVRNSRVQKWEHPQ